MQIPANLAHPTADGAHYNVVRRNYACLLYYFERTFAQRPGSFEFLFDYDLPMFLETRAKRIFKSVNISRPARKHVFLLKTHRTGDFADPCFCLKFLAT